MRVAKAWTTPTTTTFTYTSLCVRISTLQSIRWKSTKTTKHTRDHKEKEPVEEEAVADKVDVEDREMVRHKPLVPLTRPRELVLACTSMRSNVNLSAIARNAGCAGIEKMIIAGPDGKILRDIARNSSVKFSHHQSLAPQLKKLKQEGYAIVALEQTKTSTCLYDFKFERKTALVIGNERTGIPAAALDQVDHVVEIPVYGLPYSHNVASATAMAIYEYCRQFPNG